MLETVSLSAVRPSSTVRGATLPISVALHVVAVAAAVFASVWAVNFPVHPPDQFSIGPTFRTLPVPEPSPGRSAPERAPSPAPRSVPTVPTAPREIPDTVPVPSSAAAGLATPDTATVPGSGLAGSQHIEGADDAGGAGGDGSAVGTGVAVIGDGVGPLPVGGDVRAPRVTHRVDPSYPQSMLKLKKQGTVVVQCVIDRDGRVREVDVLRSPHPMFDDAAIEAVRQWQFAPGTLNGRPVDVIFVLTVNFQLSR